VDARGERLVLKVGWRHPEALNEAAALRLWNGDGAVLVHAEHVEGETSALLLERCVPGDTLASRTEPEQDEVVSGLLQRLWQPPTDGHPLRPLSSMCELWAAGFERRRALCPGPVDPGMARAAVTLLRELPRETTDEVVLCTDLHAGNVLRAQREPWLAIDPKPYVGDRAYDPVQHLLNCRERLGADPVALTDGMAARCGVDAARLRLWVFARCVQESLDDPDLYDVARQIAP
jgi:streptomycin 6-kinase